MRIVPSFVPSYVAAVVVVLTMISSPLAAFSLATFAFVFQSLVPGMVVVTLPNLAYFMMSKILVVVLRGRATR